MYHLNRVRVIKNTAILTIYCIVLVTPCYATGQSKDSLNTKLPQSVLYLEFIARLNPVGINYEPILFYDSTAFFNAGLRGGLMVGVGTNVLFPIYGIRIDAPVIPVIVIGKEYGLEIGAGIDFQWWINKVGFNSGGYGNTYNSVKLTGVLGYRHYSFDLPHRLFRMGIAPTRQADGHILWSYYFSFGI